MTAAVTAMVVVTVSTASIAIAVWLIVRVGHNNGRAEDNQRRQNVAIRRPIVARRFGLRRIIVVYHLWLRGLGLWSGLGLVVVAGAVCLLSIIVTIGECRSDQSHKHCRDKKNYPYSFYHFCSPSFFYLTLNIITSQSIVCII